MIWSKVFEKGLKGVIPALLALLAAQADGLTGWLVSLIPPDIAQMTIAGIVAFVVNAIANWLKHRTKTETP
jgi:predicted PurR-regulated permease PerM